MPIDNDWTAALELARSDRERSRNLANKLSAADTVLLYDDRGGDDPLADEDVEFIIMILRRSR